MKLSILILALLLISGSFYGALASEKNMLDRFLWKNRIILLYAPSA